MRFRKKPVEVEALRWTGTNARQIHDWMRGRGEPSSHTIALFVTRRSVTAALWEHVADLDWSDDVTAAVYDYLHETYVGVKNGQWIICGVKGEFYPCDADTFESTYERVGG